MWKVFVFRGLGTRTKHSGSNTSSCGTTQWSTCHGGNSSSVCTCHGTSSSTSSIGLQQQRWERFAGTRSPLQLAASCPQSKSRSQSHADVQLRLSRSSQVWAKKKITGEIESSSSIHIWDEEELGITVTRCICPLWW